jgi:hypothetical protein
MKPPRATQVIFVGAAAIAMFTLFDAAPPGTGETTVAPESVRLVDQTTDLPATPAPPLSPLVPPGVVLPPGTVVEPGGLPLPPLLPGLVLPPEVPQMLAQASQMLASPPNVPNEVCRFNTVRVPCP